MHATNKHAVSDDDKLKQVELEAGIPAGRRHFRAFAQPVPVHVNADIITDETYGSGISGIKRYCTQCGVEYGFQLLSGLDEKHDDCRGVVFSSVERTVMVAQSPECPVDDYFGGLDDQDLVDAGCMGASMSTVKSSREFSTQDLEDVRYLLEEEEQKKLARVAEAADMMRLALEDQDEWSDDKWPDEDGDGFVDEDDVEWSDDGGWSGGGDGGVGDDDDDAWGNHVREDVRLTREEMAEDIQLGADDQGCVGEAKAVDGTDGGGGWRDQVMAPASADVCWSDDDDGGWSDQGGVRDDGVRDENVFAWIDQVRENVRLTREEMAAKMPATTTVDLAREENAAGATDGEDVYWDDLEGGDWGDANWDAVFGEVDACIAAHSVGGSGCDIAE